MLDPFPLKLSRTEFANILYDPDSTLHLVATYTRDGDSPWRFTKYELGERTPGRPFLIK